MPTTTAPTFDDYFQAGRLEAINRTPDLTFDEGDITEMEQAAAAAMADHLTEYAAARVKATFLDGAFGDDLTTLADDRYGIQREAAVASTVTLTFSRTTTTLTGTIPAGTVVATQKDTLGNEVQFTTDVDLGWSAGDASKTAAATCTQTGAAGNVQPGAINRVVTATLFQGFSVTNAARAAGGAEEESDDSLKDRCRQFYSTLRRGTLSALEYGAKSVAGVANATAVEPGDGTVTLYISDASGSSSPTLVSNTTTEIENWRAAGVVVNVLGGSVVNVTGIVVTLLLRAGVVVNATDVKNAIVGRVAKLKIGENLSPTLIKNAVASVDPDGILDVTVASPAGTVVAGAGQVLRTTAADITVS